jgi:hypothetical protein
MNWYKKAQSLDINSIEKKLKPYLDKYVAAKVDRTWEKDPLSPEIRNLHDAVGQLSKVANPIIKDLYEKKDIISLELLAKMFKKYDSIESFYCYQAIGEIESENL